MLLRKMIARSLFKETEMSLTREASLVYVSCLS
jgi:hypothetical protein